MRSIVVAAIALAAQGGCFSETPMVGTTTDDATTTTSSSCERGTVGCPCFPNATCDAGLVCEAGICAPVTATGADGTTTAAEGTTSTTGTGDSSTTEGTSTGAASTSEGSTTDEPVTHTLFTTSTSYTGIEVGGLAGADAICTELGQGLRAGPWVAVLRDSITSLSSRITVEGDVLNTVGELLATSEAELLSGTVQAVPGYDEDGAEVSSQHLVWTGSEASDCVGWSTDEVAYLGTVGLPTDPGRWLDTEVPLPCSAAPRLYCLSQ